jgi:hypothetical protein
VGGLALCGRADAPRRPQVRHQVRAQRIGTHEEHRCNAGQGRASRARACGVCIVAHEWHINVCHNTLVARCVLWHTIIHPWPSLVRWRGLCESPQLFHGESLSELSYRREITTARLSCPFGTGPQPVGAVDCDSFTKRKLQDNHSAYQDAREARSINFVFADSRLWQVLGACRLRFPCLRV